FLFSMPLSSRRRFSRLWESTAQPAYQHRLRRGAGAHLAAIIHKSGPHYHRKRPKPVTARASQRLSIITTVESDRKVKIELNVGGVAMKWLLNQINHRFASAQAVAFLRSHRRLLMALSLLIASAIFVAAWTVKRRAEREFEAARAMSEERSL